MNAANYRFGYNVIMREPNAKGERWIQCHSDLMLHPFCTDSKIDVEVILNSFHDVEERLLKDLPERMKCHQFHPDSFKSVFLKSIED